MHRVKHGQVIAAFLGRSVDQPVGVDVGVAFVARYLVVQIGFGIGPIPLRDHDVALDALGTRRGRRGNFALRDARGPIAELGGGAFCAQLREAAFHGAAGLSGLHAARPGLGRGIEFGEHRRNGAGIFVAELVAGFAAVGLDEMEPLALGLDVCRNAVPGGPRAREFVLLGHLQHRVPILGGVKLRGGLRVRRDGWFQVDLLARLGLDFGRVDEPVAARPNRVLAVWKVRHEIAAAIVGDNFFDVAGGQGSGLGDHPDAGFGAFRAGDDAADIGGFDLNLWARFLCAQMRPGGDEVCSDAYGCCTGEVQ